MKTNSGEVHSAQISSAQRTYVIVINLVVLVAMGSGIWSAAYFLSVPSRGPATGSANAMLVGTIFGGLYFALDAAKRIRSATAHRDR